MSNIVQQSQTSLASTQLPAHIASLASQTTEFRDDLGELDRADFGLSFLKLVTSSSKEMKPNWDKKGAQAMPYGSMFLSRTHEIVPIDTEIIFLYRKVTYIKWLGRPGAKDSKMEFATDDKDDPKIVRIGGLDFIEDPATGKPKPPLVTKYINMYFISPYNPNEPAVISFYRTGTKAGRSLTQDLLRATSGGKLPLYAAKYVLGAPGEETDGANSWPSFNVIPAGRPSAEAIQRAIPMADVARALASTFSNNAQELEDAPVHIQEAAGETLDAPDVYDDTPHSVAGSSGYVRVPTASASEQPAAPAVDAPPITPPPAQQPTKKMW